VDGNSNHRVPFGHDGKFCRRNETLCVDRNEYAELKYALRIYKLCSVLQLSPIKHVNTHYTIQNIFKIQCIVSERDCTAMSPDILLSYIYYGRWRSFPSNKLSFVARRCRKHGQNNFGAFSNHSSLGPSNDASESSKVIINSHLNLSSKTLLCKGII
jgi:hypothetical protein